MPADSKPEVELKDLSCQSEPDKQPASDTERKEEIQREREEYSHTVEAQEVFDEEDQGEAVWSRVAGATAGAAVLGGALAFFAGPAIVLAGASVGCILGTMAGAAIAREWIRGENQAAAIEYDMSSEDRDQEEEQEEEDDDTSIIDDIGVPSPSAKAPKTQEQRGQVPAEEAIGAAGPEEGVSL